MNVTEALKLPSLRNARLVAGAEGAGRTIRWVPIVELPDPLPWVGAGDFLLTTGVNWPRDEEGIARLIGALADRRLAGVALAVPQYFAEMPEAARLRADERGLALVEIPWEVQFHAVTREIIGAIMDKPYRLQEQSEWLLSLSEDGFVINEQATRQAARYGVDPQGTYALGMLAANVPVPLARDGILRRERLADKLQAALEAQRLPSVCALLHDRVLFLVPDEAAARLLWHAVRDDDISLAVSLPRQGLEQIRNSRREAAAMLPLVPYGELRLYADMMVSRVLTDDHEMRSAYLGHIFGRLQPFRNKDVLIRTLLVHALTGFQLKKTAEKLNIHPKTLRYRLDQAARHGGFDLDDAETRFRLQLAGRIVRLDSRMSKIIETPQS